MNRRQRRDYFRAYRKILGLGTWFEWNDPQDHQLPYINYRKRELKRIRSMATNL